MKNKLTEAEKQVLQSIALAMSCVNSYNVAMQGDGLRVVLHPFNADLFCLLHHAEQSLRKTFDADPTEYLGTTTLTWKPEPKSI